MAQQLEDKNQSFILEVHFARALLYPRPHHVGQTTVATENQVLTCMFDASFPHNTGVYVFRLYTRNSLVERCVVKGTIGYLDPNLDGELDVPIPRDAHCLCTIKLKSDGSLFGVDHDNDQMIHKDGRMAIFTVCNAVLYERTTDGHLVMLQRYGPTVCLD